MAKNFSLDFKDFLDVAYRVSEAGGDAALKRAVENAFETSKNAQNVEVGKAMKNSDYSFKAGEKGSRGRARESLIEVSETPVQWDGTVATAYIGVDLEKAPEVAILIHGTPHIKPDTNLKNALKVKGKYLKRIKEIQAAEFNKVINEVMEGNGDG